MIKFFRKIRQKLLLENRISKYLMYAIGEIVLVVIGILIALAINSRQEQNKRQNEIADYLTIIKNSFLTDVAAAREIQEYRDSSVHYSKICLENIMTKELTIQEFGQVFSLNYNPSVGKTLDANRNGLNTLVSSGLIAKIKNPEIRDSIFTYYKVVEELEKTEVEFYQAIRNLNINLWVDVGVLEFLKSTFQTNTVKARQEEWFQEFFNSPHLHLFHIKNIEAFFLRQGYPAIIEKGSYIVDLLEKEIE